MSKEVKPITPNEAESKRLESIDPEMIEAVNELLAKEVSNGYAKIMQKDIEKLYRKKKRVATMDIRQLDFEDIYRKAGWKVSYDKPGYNESYEPSFEFKRKKNK